MTRSSVPEGVEVGSGRKAFWLAGAWIVLTLAGAWGILQQQIHEARYETQHQAERLHASMVDRAMLNEAAIEGLATALRVCPRGDFESSRNYAHSILSRYPHIYLAGAVARIGHDSRGGFESDLRAQGLGGEIRWFDYEGERRWHRVPDKAQYWPVQMAEPEVEAKWAILGLDLEHVPLFRDALHQAQQTAKPVSSGAFELVTGSDARAFGMLLPVCEALREACDSRDPEHTPNFVAFLVVFAEALVDCRSKAELGFACRLWFEGDDFSPQQALLLAEEPTAAPPLIDRVLFPRVEYRAASSVASQPLVLELVRQLGRSEVNLAPMLALLFVSAIGLAVALHYLRQSERSNRARVAAYRALAEERSSLELRVRERTGALRGLNEALEQENEARKTAEQAVKQQSEQLRLLTRRLMAAQETERRNLVRELHDDVGQALTAVRTHASVIRNQHSSSEDVCPRSAQTIMDLSGQLYESIHRIMRQLRPRALDDLGLSVALQSCIDGAGLEAAGIAVDVRIGEGLERLDETAAIAVYRLLQEALTNVVRHADAKTVWIRVACKKRPKAPGASAREVLEISVEDDGRGFPEGGVPVQRLGLLGIEERVHSVGGDLVIGNRPSGGMFMRAVIPVAQGESDG